MRSVGWKLWGQTLSIGSANLMSEAWFTSNDHGPFSDTTLGLLEKHLDGVVLRQNHDLFKYSRLIVSFALAYPFN